MSPGVRGFNSLHSLRARARPSWFRNMSEIKSIPVGKIVITGDNPRKEFDLESLNLLGDSIQSHGLLQLIIVRPKEGYYELVVGERRLRAVQLKGMYEIEARIEDLDDATCMEFRLIENIHREDLTDAEKGDAVYALVEKYSKKYPSIKEVAKSIKTPSDTVYTWTNKSRKTSKYVKSLVIGDKLSEYQVKTLLKYDHPTQDKLADIFIKHELTSRNTNEFIKLYDEKPFVNLDELASESKGIKIVEIKMEALSDEARTEVEAIIGDKKIEAEKKRMVSLIKARKATRVPRKKDEKVKEEIEAIKSIAKDKVEEVVTEAIAKEALKRKLAKPNIFRQKLRPEFISTPNLDELGLPYGVESKLMKKINNPVARFEIGKAIKEQGFEVWETDMIIELAAGKTDLSLEKLIENVKNESRKRKEKHFLILEVHYEIWEALDIEAERRRGPRGRLELKEVAVELLAERLKELGYNISSNL